MRFQIEGLTLERAHLQVLQNEVLGGALLVDGVFQREGITHVDSLLLTERVKAIVLRNRLVGAQYDVFVGRAFSNGRVAVATHQGESAASSRLDFKAKCLIVKHLAFCVSLLAQPFCTTKGGFSNTVFTIMNIHKTN